MPSQDISNDSTKRVLPWLVAIAVFMESLDTTILNTAVPAIASALQVAPLSMKAVLSSYTLSLAVFIPVSGWMADRYGTRRVFSAAIGLFTLGSILCGISNSIHMLVICRILQGCGGAVMVPVGRLTRVRTFAKSELIRAMSFVAVPALIGPMLGPVAGGLIVGFLHWRMIFFINVPIGILGLYFVYRHLPDFREEHVDQLDIIGLILFGAGVALLSYVLEVFGEHTLSGREILTLLALSFILLLGYVRHAAAIARPLLRLGLFGIRTFRVSVIGGFIIRLAVGGMPFLLPLLYQVGLGYTPVHSGFLIMPQTLAAMSLKMAMPIVLTRFGYRPSAQLQYRDHWTHSRTLRHHRARYAGVAHCAPSLLLRILFVPAIHEYEYARIRRHRRKRHEHGEHHRQHWTTDGDQLQRCFGLASCSALYP